MEELNGIDTMPIRRRLETLKVESGMDSYDFCKIYAPERCKKTKDNARNYISQVFSGGTSINNKPVPINIEHLLNIVNSDKFPGVTLNFLVYGDENPVKIEKTIDFDLKRWTHADICEFLWVLKTRYPEFITIEENCETPVEDRSPEELQFYFGQEVPIKRTINISIEETNDIDASYSRVFSIGQAIALFHYDMRDSEDNHDPEIRELALTKAVNRMRSREQLNNPYLKDISNCDKESPFIIAYGE